MDASCIRVLSIDDHPLVREGIGTIIKSQADMLLLGTASNCKEGITAFRALSPDVTLMDLRLPDLSGLDVMIAIRSEFPACRKDKSWGPARNWDQAGVLHTHSTCPDFFS
jgi:YesN/AraC family two-component response regulator